MESETQASSPVGLGPADAAAFQATPNADSETVHGQKPDGSGGPGQQRTSRHIKIQQCETLPSNTKQERACLLVQQLRRAEMPESQNTPVCFLQGNRDTILKQESVLCEARHVG